MAQRFRFESCQSGGARVGYGSGAASSMTPGRAAVQLADQNWATSQAARATIASFTAAVRAAQIVVGLQEEELSVASPKGIVTKYLADADGRIPENSAARLPERNFQDMLENRLPG
jgi:hypothetical protein